MDLLHSLLGSMTSNSSIDALAGKSGASTDSVQKAISSALPSLLGSLTKNASTTTGAKSLLGALSQHEDASDVSSQIKNADEKDGGKIIGKILGDGKDDFISSIAKEAGINVGQSSQILSSIAPALLSAIASASKSDSDTSKNSSKKSDSDEGSLIGGLLGNIFKDDNKKASSKKSNSGFDGSDLLDILKKTVL